MAAGTVTGSEGSGLSCPLLKAHSNKKAHGTKAHGTVQNLILEIVAPLNRRCSFQTRSAAECKLSSCIITSLTHVLASALEDDWLRRKSELSAAAGCTPCSDSAT